MFDSDIGYHTGNTHNQHKGSSIVTRLATNNTLPPQGVPADSFSDLVAPGSHYQPGNLWRALERLTHLAHEEDLPDWERADTYYIVDNKRDAAAYLMARQDGVLAGIWGLALIIRQFSPQVRARVFVRDGSVVTRGQKLATLTGPLAGILVVERTMLNFLSTLSGIASLTRRFVEAIHMTEVVVTDTRKTALGYRLLAKYAVFCGGGVNHRLNLCDGIMIKDNHIAAMSERPLHHIVRDARARSLRQGRQIPIWVEIDRLDQLDAAIDAEPDFILLDNMPPDILRQAVEHRDTYFRSRGGQGQPKPLLEASGGIDLTTIEQVARAGVDRISIGALTHSAPALDFALDIHPDGKAT